MIGIRPEDITIIKGEKPDAVEAKVDVIEPVGSDTYLYLDLEGLPLIARTGPYDEFAPGENVRVIFHESRFHLFSKKDGSRID
jgi:multiple sugar transport system ATP-binding protein